MRPIFTAALAALLPACGFDGATPNAQFDASPFADVRLGDGGSEGLIGFGDGHDQVWDGSSDISPTSPLIAPIRAGTSGVAVDTQMLAFEVDDVVMVWQTALPQTNLPDPAMTDIDLDDLGVGHYLMRRVTAVTPSFVEVSPPFTRDFDVPGAQVILVPQFSQLTLLSGSPSREEWLRYATRPPHGGVLIALVDGPVSNEGSFRTVNSGFLGGNPSDTGDASVDCSSPIEPAPNGVPRGEGLVVNSFGSTGRGRSWTSGGGGVCSNSGGGGGGGSDFGGAGGDSTDGPRAVGGEGGARVMAFNPRSHLLMGAGGGAGHNEGVQNRDGGDGGGVILLIARSITGGGAFEADGESGPGATSAAGGGGGTGGTIALLAEQPVTCGLASANGGQGGDVNGEFGPGGGGSGGFVFIEPAGSPCEQSARARSGRAGRRTDIQLGATNCRGAGPFCCGDGIVTAPYETCEIGDGGCNNNTCR